jgi:hypothetical protein
VDARECAELAETVALVTDSWLLVATAAPEPERPPITKPRATAAARAETTAPAEPAPAPGERPPTPPRPLALDFALGSALGIDTIASRGVKESLVALMRAGAELNLSAWHIGVRGQVETPQELAPAGTISVRRWSSELLLGADVHRAERWALVTSFAAGMDLLAVSNSSRPPGALFAPSVAAGLRGEWAAFSSVGLTAAMEGVVALRRDRFLVGRDDSWHTPRVRARVSIGALWHL